MTQWIIMSKFFILGEILALAHFNIVLAFSTSLLGSNLYSFLYNISNRGTRKYEVKKILQIKISHYEFDLVIMIIR
jgi:hypothetical protein